MQASERAGGRAGERAGGGEAGKATAAQRGVTSKGRERERKRGC